MMVIMSQFQSSRIAQSHPSLSTALLARVQQMEPDAWNRLVETFGPIVYQWARTSGLNADDAADVVQDVFAKVAKGIVSFERQKQHGSFRSWLATITRNRIRDFFRRDQVKHPSPAGGTEALQQMQNVPDPLQDSISELDIDRRLPARVLELVQSEIEPRTWQAFWLTTVEARTARDVAEQLEMQLASVYQAKSRVLRRLRQRLDELP
ncbi:MAG: RNA polymerase sigma factor [Pirellulaceae bacterium]